MIVGIGVDLVDIERVRRHPERAPGLLERVFHPAELVDPSGKRLGWRSLAARFAAKEAVAKALGAPGGIDWLDGVVSESERGGPAIALTGGSAELAARLGVAGWHLSLARSGGFAVAYAVAEGRATSG